MLRKEIPTWAASLLIVVLLLVASGAVLNYSPDVRAAITGEIDRYRESGFPGYACNLAQDFTRKTLLHPSSAEFASCNNSAVTIKEIKQKSGWTISGPVSLYDGVGERRTYSYVAAVLRKEENNGNLIYRGRYYLAALTMITDTGVHNKHNIRIDDAAMEREWQQLRREGVVE